MRRSVQQLVRERDRLAQESLLLAAQRRALSDQLVQLRRANAAVMVENREIWERARDATQKSSQTPEVKEYAPHARAYEGFEMGFG